MLALGSRLRSILNRLPRVESPVWLLAVLVLACVLRLFHIGASSLWADEAFSWLVARQPAWAILTQRLEPILPPLYHFLLHFWIRLGESETVLRGFSALCGLLTVPVIYALGRELFTPATGLAAALLTAVLPFQVYFAQETRLYALVILLSALLLWGFVRACNKASWWRWTVLGFLFALNLYAHYFTAFILLVLHALMLHGGLWDRVLPELLPIIPIEIMEYLYLLEAAGLVQSDQGFWRVTPQGYPAVRQSLQSEGYLVDDI